MLLSRLIACALIATTGCVAPVEPEPTSQTVANIAGGELAPDETAVVGLLTGHGSCSGTLIARNLVLTAHHCVAETPPGSVECGSAEFGPIHTNILSITTRDTVLGTVRHVVRETLVPPNSSDVCGGDVAVMILDDLVEPDEAWAIPPRIDQNPIENELYRAVGFGATDGAGSGSGLRRQRENLHVNCLGGDCLAIYGTQPNEWMGETGICAGDSGGPAIDEQGRVIGVTSRGGENCSTPIYSDVAGWSSWLMEMGERAAELGDYEPDPWVRGGSTLPTTPPEPAPEAGHEASPSDVAVDASGGCQLSAGAAGPGPFGALLLLSMLGCIRRPRRRGGLLR